MLNKYVTFLDVEEKLKEILKQAHFLFALNTNMSSLEKSCLDLIVQKFERFYYAFIISKDANLNRNFEFLQRRYSVRLATTLYENKKLKEEYFDLLINEHLNFLDGKWFKNSRYLNSMEDIFHRLPNLQRICFSSCGDDILENVARFCPKIVEIDVRHSSVTDNGVDYLCKNENGTLPCPELKNLFVWPSRVTGRGAGSLIRNLLSLEKVDYTVPLVLQHIHEENLSLFNKVHYYNLVELNLLRFNGLISYPDMLKTCLTVCPKLESFACCISNKEQLNLFSNIRLKKLHLQFSTTESSINIDNFLKLNGNSLTYLKISDCVMSVSGLAVYCPVLKEFFAHRVKFTDDDNLPPPIFSSLIECTFSHIDPSAGKEVCLFISSSPVLESISFTYCILSREVQIRILMWCKNPSASKIEFWCLDLELYFLRDILLNCPSLKEISLTECSVDVHNTKEILQNIAKSLPNKPKIVFFQMFSER